MGLDPIPYIQLIRKPTNKQWRPTRTCQAMKPVSKDRLEKLKQTKENINYTFFWWKWANMPQLGEAPLLRMGELWLNGRMDERESEWLERQMVSRHSLEQHNNMQERNDLRVTPTPLFIDFLGFFRVLRPWQVLQPRFWAFIPFCPIFSSFWGFKHL